MNRSIDLPKIEWKVIGVLVLAKIALQLLGVHSIYELHRDEYLYLALGQHPDFGFWSNPPLIGWFSGLIHATLGPSIFFIRLFPLLFGISTMLLAILITREVGGKQFAQLLTGITFLIAPAFLRSSSLFMPVVIDLFFWTLCYWAVLKFINTNQRQYLLVLGVAIGLGLLNKYLLLLLVISIVLGVLFTSNREKLFRPEMTWVVGIALLLVLPNIIWQARYHYPVISHMTELNANQLSNVSTLQFLIDQIWITAPAIFLWLPAIVFLFFHKRFNEYQWIAWSALIVMASLVLLNGKSYYALGIYPCLIAIGARVFEMTVKSSFLRLGVVGLLALVGVLMLPVSLPIFSPDKAESYYDQMDRFRLFTNRTWENGRSYRLPQDYADMLGWKELAAIVKQAVNRVDNPNEMLLYCENYGQAGAIDYYNQSLELPAAVSFSDSYRLWIPRRNEQLTTLIYVNDTLGEDIANLFETIELIGVVKDEFAREQGTQVYLCQHPKSSLVEFWELRVKEVSASFLPL